MPYPHKFPEFFIVCSGGSASYKEFDQMASIHEIKRRAVWPDCIGSYYSHGPLLFSERVVAALRESGISGLNPRIAKFKFRKAKTEKATEAPWNYYAIGITGEMEFMVEIYERIEDRDGIRQYEFRFATADLSDPRLRYGANGYFSYHRFIPRRDAWDGCDCFRAKARGFLFGEFGCSRRFIELAREHRWTNIRFKLLDSLADFGIDHLAQTWPPESWTPPDDRLIIGG